jgi:D-sedoheptulose 7-phosphate isomerase
VERGAAAEPVAELGGAGGAGRVGGVGGVVRGELTSAGIVIDGEPVGGSTPARQIMERLAYRTAANAEFFAAEAERIALLCHRVAERYARGGRILAFGISPAARSDVRHVTVEFVHPVIVGKRALPAIGLTREAGPLPMQLDLLASPADVAIGFGSCGAGPGLPDAPDGGAAEAGELREALALARARGCLTIAFDSLGAEWEFHAPGEDPFIRQEVIETLYHIVWELVHVFFEHRGLLEGRQDRVRHDAGGSSFLYPFLAEAEVDLDTVLEDVRASVLMKAVEVSELREQTLRAVAPRLGEAARALRECFDAGGRLLAFGNGGSATDATDAVADFRDPPRPWPRRPALDLTEDTAIITALANDIGPDSIFSRQIISHGRAGDAVLALSTSGNSRNIIQALGEARRRGLCTLALVGYGGGRILAERLADHVVVIPSQHIPRIQEAQASVYHILRELVELGK